jgi:TatD DNase family protein
MLIDSHAHLDMKAFREDLDDVLDRAFKVGVQRIVCVGIDLPSSRRTISLAQVSEHLYATVGCHPHHAHQCQSNDLDALTHLASNPKVVAWGEIGLDFHRDFSPHEAQMKAFFKQLHIARELQLPVIIHDREAHDDILKTLKRMGKGKRLGVIHCFSGDLELAKSLTGLGYYISVPGTVTYKNAKAIREVAGKLDLDRLLIETDAPFLTPAPNRGKRNEPAFIRITAEEIARLRRIRFEEVALHTTQNAESLFSLSEAT